MILRDEKEKDKNYIIDYAIAYLFEIITHPEWHCTQFELKGLREKLNELTEEKIEYIASVLKCYSREEIEFNGICKWVFGYKNSVDYMANAFFKEFIETTNFPIALFPKRLEVTFDFDGIIFEWDNETPMKKITTTKSLGYSTPVHGLLKLRFGKQKLMRQFKKR